MSLIGVRKSALLYKPDTGGPTLPPYASDLTYFIDVQQSEITLSGSDITAISDLSGVGVATTGTTNVQLAPDGIGMRAVASSQLLIDTAFSHDNQNSTVFIAGFRAGGVTNTQALLYMPQSGGTNRFALYDAGSDVRTFDSVNFDTGPKVLTGPTVYWCAAGSTEQLIGLNQISVSRTQSAAGTVTGGKLFRWDATNFPNTSYDIAAVIAYNRKLSVSEVNEVLDFCNTRYYVPSSSCDTLMLIDGDSLSTGTQSSDARTKQWPAQLARLGGNVPAMFGAASGGKQIQTTAAIPTEWGTVLTYYDSLVTNRVGVLWLGSNDLANGRTATQVNADIDSWITSATTADAGIILIGCTILPRGDLTAGEETDRGTVNTHITTTAAFDHVVDLASLPELDDDTDTNYFDADGIHLNDAGYAVVAAAIRAEMVTQGYI